jgi:magnesium transporter
MITNLTKPTVCNYEWLDVIDPTDEELASLADKYGLDSASIHDYKQVGHLPKYEQLKTHTFIILRIYLPDVELEADSVQEITHKVAVFYNDKFLLTIHRKDWPLMAILAQYQEDNGGNNNPTHLIGKIVKACLLTYESPGMTLTRSIEIYERKIFLAERQVALLKNIYYIKRKLDVIKRLLILTGEVIENVDAPGKGTPFTRDIRDLYVRQRTLFDSLTEHANHLLNIYFNISAQRTNDTIRVLTIFSVFFLPLTFIVGVYGMNFEWMPEIKWKYGYPATWVSMILVVTVIYLWFRRKKWL